MRFLLSQARTEAHIAPLGRTVVFIRPVFWFPVSLSSVRSGEHDPKKTLGNQDGQELGAAPSH